MAAVAMSALDTPRPDHDGPRSCAFKSSSIPRITAFADRVQHKLKAYTLDLLGEDSCDFVITAAEFKGERFDRRCEFHARETFRQREVSSVYLPPGTLLDEDEFRIDCVVLDHGTPCLAFAFEEKLRAGRQ